MLCDIHLIWTGKIWIKHWTHKYLILADPGNFVPPQNLWENVFFFQIFILLIFSNVLIVILLGAKTNPKIKDDKSIIMKNYHYSECSKEMLKILNSKGGMQLHWLISMALVNYSTVPNLP